MTWTMMNKPLLILVATTLYQIVLVRAEIPVLNLTVIERQTDYISIGWTVNDTNSLIDSYSVHVRNAENTGTITYEGIDYIDQETLGATVRVHTPDHEYNVCVVARLTNGSLVEECVMASSIPRIQMSSIIAVVCVFLFVILCIVVAFISWKCMARRLQKKAKAREMAEENGNGDIIPLTHLED